MNEPFRLVTGVGVWCLQIAEIIAIGEDRTGGVAGSLPLIVCLSKKGTLPVVLLGGARGASDCWLREFTSAGETFALGVPGCGSRGLMALLIDCDPSARLLTPLCWVEISGEEEEGMIGAVPFTLIEES